MTQAYNNNQNNALIVARLAPTTTVSSTETFESTSSRRSSFSALTDLFRTRSRSPSSERPRSSFESDRRLSSDATGPYTDVIPAQALYMDKLRTEQAMNGITHNVDGLPLPPAPAARSRRTSLAHILGLDKPLLAL